MSREDQILQIFLKNKYEFGSAWKYLKSLQTKNNLKQVQQK
jgi:hypothetical protein